MERLQRAKAPLKRASTLPPKRTHGGGMAQHQPDKDSRDKVESFAGIGYSEDKIAQYLGISDVTLRKYYPNELAYGEMHLMKLAYSGLQKGLKDNKSWAIQFTLRLKGRKMGWSERTEITGADGRDLMAPIDMSRLTDEQLIKLRNAQSILAEIASSVAIGAGDSEEES